jgi:hypothetical protein
MTDTYSSYAASLTAPAINSAAITPDDSTDLAYVSRAISVDVEGFVKYAPLGTQGDAIVTRLLVAGVQHPIRAKRIYATGTTATGVVVDW